MNKVIMATFLLMITGILSSALSDAEGEYAKAYQYLEGRGEVYIKFEISSRSEIKKLTHMLSLDRVDGNEVVANVSKAEFANFLKLNIDFETVTPPGELLKNLKMSDFTDRNNRDWNYYPTYQGYVNLLNQFESDYPGICKVYDLGPAGVASKNHRIYAVKITDNITQDEAEPGFIYSAAIHGDELLGFVTMLHFIDTLLSSYSFDTYIKSFVDNIEIWILPLCNPDGTYPRGDSSVQYAQRRNVADNFDLNRNSPCPCLSGNHQYYGLYSYHAAETKARLDFENQHDFVISADVHGGTEAAIWPYNAIYQRHVDEDWFKFVANQYVSQVHIQCNNNGYMTSCGGDGVGHGYTELYEAHGTISDSRTYFQQCRTLYLELSIRKLLDPSDLLKHWEYNYPSLFEFMEQVFYGIRGIVTDSKTGDPLNAKVYIENHDDDSSHVYSNLPHGDYYRPIIAGGYDVTFSCDDYHSKTISNVIVENNQAAVLNVELLPNISINVSTPNGGEMLYVGEDYDIAWLSHTSVGDVNIEYSLNNGADWSLIVGTTDNDGLYTWNVPNEPSTTCLIRIYEASTNDPIDTSDNVFTISSPVIELSSPNGGEVLYEGDSHIITWVNKGFIGNVDIEYSIDNGQNWLTVANNITNSGSHPWTVPGNPSSSCKVHVSETADGDPVDVSDNVFTISPPVIDLSSPNGGEAWYIGKTYNISWSTKGFVGDVKIEYSTDNGSNWADVIAGTANDGSHPWTIPDESSMTCKIRISEASDGIPYDESNGAFIIEIEPSISLTFPVGGEVLYIDSTYTIRWSTIGRVGNVKIEYSINNGATWPVIISQTENDGLFDWKVPSISSMPCKIRVSEAADEIPADTSDNVFIEAAPSVSVSYPNGGEVLYIGMVYKIQWSTTGQVGDIKIEYSTDDGSTWEVIESGVTNNGSYNWTIPDEESVVCRIRISEAADDNPFDISDNTFEIAQPFIELSSPNGGEVLKSGFNHYISWQGEGFTGDVRIEYSVDNGVNWAVVVDNTANDGSHSWTVPNNPSVNCKVRVSEVTNSNPFDESDAAFEIEFGTAILDQDKKPNGFNGSFDIVPNPINKGFEEKVSFILKTTESIQDVTVKVYDPLGSIVYESEKLLICNANQQYAFHPWYLKNISGRLVAGGSYLAVLMARDKDGKAVVVKRIIGIKEYE